MNVGRTIHHLKGACPMDEKACSCLKKSAPDQAGARRARYGVAKRLSSPPFVSMVQAAHLRNGNDTTVLRSVDGSRLRGVFRQG